MNIDFGKVASDYAKYRDRLPEQLFEQLREKGIEFWNQDVVDLGAGTGMFSRDLAARGARVLGVEPSEELIQAASAVPSSGLPGSVQYLKAFAETFSSPQSFPIVTAVRAWHWFDRIQTIQNVKRVLEPGGLLIVIDSIFLPDSEIAKITFETIKRNGIERKPAGSKAETAERRNGFPAHWFEEWQAHGFEPIHEWQQDYMLPYTHEEWCGKIRSVSWMVHAEQDLKSKVTQELMQALSTFPSPVEVPHRYSVAVLKWK